MTIIEVIQAIEVPLAIKFIFTILLTYNNSLSKSHKEWNIWKLPEWIFSLYQIKDIIYVKAQAQTQSANPAQIGVAAAIAVGAGYYM